MSDTAAPEFTYGDGERAVRLRIPAKAEYITLCRLALTGLGRVREIGDDTMADLKLALTEAVMACKVTDEVHAEAKRHFSDAEYVELSLTAGFYAMVSRMLDALRVELDDDVREHSPRLP